DRFVLTENQGSDTINDFTQGEDLIGLTGQLTFAQLTLVSDSNNTLIRMTNTNEILATLINVSAKTLTQNDFEILP
ncbi:hypothetical protein, partial [Planktothrix sp.]|uniref:hypothetical protein n=1 Tax=Planktothrix sp. TaxID=3088171 RepID=UPI0038D39370